MRKTLKTQDYHMMIAGAKALDFRSRSGAKFVFAVFLLCASLLVCLKFHFALPFKGAAMLAPQLRHFSYRPSFEKHSLKFL